MQKTHIEIRGAREHNLKNLDLEIARGKITVVTGLSGSGKSSLAFDTILAEAQRRFFYTLSHYTRQFLDLGSRPQVQKISGLSPAIALAQNETQPSLRATVGTLSDISELLGVLFARFGSTYCPDHNEPTASLSAEQIAAHIADSLPGKTIAICAPLAREKKGIFKAQMTSFATKGFAKAYVDGAIVPLSPVPVLQRDEKHTIKVIIDHVKVKPQSLSRLVRSIETALEHGAGFGEYYAAGKGGHFDPDTDPGGTFSAGGGCPSCGYSWPRLDSRYFNANSLGRCETCNGLGMLSQDDAEDGEDTLEIPVCETCEGTGLKTELAAIRIGRHGAADYQLMPLAELATMFAGPDWGERAKANPALGRVVEEVRDKLQRIVDVGLGYLHLSRRVRTLSGGESQRLKLAGLLTESLRGILYVLDEPSQGLHPCEMERLWATLQNLKDLGNTLLVVDHDEYLMQRADWIMDLGPGGGTEGGQLLATFRPQDAAKHLKKSRTAQGLVAKTRENFVFSQEKALRGYGFLTVKKPRLHNLNLPSAKFALGAVNVVTGVSGAGKSSLVLGVLFRNLSANLTGVGRRKPTRYKFFNCDAIAGIEELEFVTIIDRKPLAKSSVSIPASYLDVFTDIRNLYAKLPAAQISGLTARSFSLSVDAGRCKECKGRGEITLSMRFLADARVRCQVCNGDRFQTNVLEVRYNGFSIADVLNLTIDEAYQIFKHQRKVEQKLLPAIDLGLGYLKLGQPSASLSGGEAQRLKLVPYLTRKHKAGSVLLLDEPTTGLHFEDVTKLMNKLHSIAEGGATVIMIEHNSEVIRRSHWAVDLGPGAAEEGGRLVYQGIPRGLCEAGDSVTGQYLI